MLREKSFYEEEKKEGLCSDCNGELGAFEIPGGICVECLAKRISLKSQAIEVCIDCNIELSSEVKEGICGDCLAERVLRDWIV